MSNRYSMHRRATLLAVSALTLLASGYGHAHQPGDDHYWKQNLRHELMLLKQGWRPVWRDEFSGRKIKQQHWSHEVNCVGGGNNEKQCYTDRPENSYVKHGKLHIVAREESYSGPGRFDDDPNYDPADQSVTLPYTSARLRTKNKFDFKYGRVEVRAKLTGGQGMWPAIWMLPTDNVYGGWPNSGEIDILEAVNLGVWPNEVHGTLHYGLAWPQWENHGQTLATDFNPADDFHVYALEWEEGEIRWYVDGKHYQTQTSEGWYNYIWKGQETGFEVANPTAPFDEKFHLIMNLATGGDWPGNPDTNWAEDRELVVDYVRVYQCKPRRGFWWFGHRSNKQGCANVDPDVAINTDAGAPGVNDYLLYDDGVEAFELAHNGATVTQATNPGSWELDPGTVFLNEVVLGGERGKVLDVLFNGTGNVFLSAQNMDQTPEFDTGVQLTGGAGWTNYGEVEFKLRVLDAAEDSQFVVKLDSGWPNLGQVVINAPPSGDWQQVKVKVSDLLANPNPNGGGVNLSNIQNLFVLEYTGTNASVQIDDIRLQCAVNTEPEVWQQDQLCGISPKVAPLVPVGDTLDIYSNGLTLWPIYDCCGGVSITEVNDNGNNQLEISYDNDPNTNTVTFFQSASPADLSSFAGGTVEFDLQVLAQPATPAAAPWMMKVDCVHPCSTGDIPLDQSVEGVLPQTGVWQHYTFNINDLVARGLNLASVDAPLVIFPTWGNQDGATFRIDNVTWTKGDGTGPQLATLPVDFDDAGQVYSFANFEGGVADVVANPLSNSNNASAQVGRMLKYNGAVYAGSTLALGESIDFSQGSTITMNVLANRSVPVLFKLEGLNVELSQTYSGSGDWEQLAFDFSAVAAAGASAVTLIFDLGVAGDAAGDPSNWTFYFDDIQIGN